MDMTSFSNAGASIARSSENFDLLQFEGDLLAILDTAFTLVHRAIISIYIISILRSTGHQLFVL